MEILLKNLKKTDIEKRLTIPSKSLKYFPPLSGKHMVDFQVKDESDRVWEFRISTRKKNNKYLKPVLTKGWRKFVCKKELRIGDRVAFYMEKEQAGAPDKAGKGHYRIEVIKRATQRSSVLSLLVQNHDADRTMAVASYINVEEDPTLTSHILDQASDSNIEEESTLTSHSTADQAITYDQTEGLHNQPVTDRVGMKFEFIGLNPHIKVREPKFIDFFELGSQERREKEQPSFLTLYHMVESPITSSTAPYFKFL
ncbi:hypothetical protein CRYUN_Cryun06bG0010400 [Craigia yunnanensis]